MLFIKSFKITEGEEISKFLGTNRISAVAHILINEGTIAIPFEDGEPESPEQKVLSLKEQRNAMSSQLDLLIHSQRVLERQNAGIENEVLKLNLKLPTAGGKKEDYLNNKRIEAEIKRLKGVIEQSEATMIQNQAEVTRLNTNIEIFNERIDEQKAQNN